MSTSYNKRTDGSRIGNWVEENALKDMTGTARYKTWVEEDDLGRTKIIPIGAGVGKDADTTRRCIYHTEHQDSAEYKSTSADLHDPSKYQYVHTGRPALGPRAAMMQRKLAQEASTKTPEEAPRAQWETAAQGAFVRHAQTAYSSPKGRRVMKTTDGVDLPPDCRDIEFLRAAHLTVPRGKLSQEEMERIAPTRALEEDTPISLYTQRRGEAVYSGTSAQSTNPFARNSHFTNDIRDGRELHATAIDDITKVPHGIRKAATTSIGSELSIELALARFKARLAHCEGLNGVRSLRGVLEKYDTSGDGHLSAEEFGAALRDLRVNVSPREVAELLAYFDTDHSGKITLAELEAGLRPVLPEGRLKIVKQAFSRADRGGDGAVTVEDLARLADVSKHPDVVMGGRTERQVLEGFLSAWDRVPDGRVTLDEFVDYYTDVSSMIEDDAVFEQMVRGCWQLPGAAGSGPALRVRVTHNDSSQEVVEVSSAGVTRDDLPLIRALLRKAGVKSIHSVQVL